MSQPLISFIVPAYNAGAYIADCLDSIYRLDMAGYGREVIVINDGSTDDTAIVLEEYRKKNSKIIVLTQENQGLSVARNAGIKIAKGRYIYFVDSDDELLSESLPANLARHLRDDNIDIIGINVIRTYCNGKQKPYRRYKNKYEKVYYPAYKFLENRNIFPCVFAYFYSNNFINKTGLRFVPHLFHEDEDFTTRAFAQANSYVACDIDFYNYIERDASITTKDDKEHQEKRLRHAIIIISNLQKTANQNVFFRKITQYKIDYLVVDVLTLLLRQHHNDAFKKEIISQLRSLKLFPLRFHYRIKGNIKYLLFNILTRILFASHR